MTLNTDLHASFRVCSYLHEADAAGQEVHEEREERGHVVYLRRLCDAAQRLQRGDDFLFDSFFLADLSKILLVDEVEKTLLQRVKHLDGQMEKKLAVCGPTEKQFGSSLCSSSVGWLHCTPTYTRYTVMTNVWMRLTYEPTF